MRTKKTFWRGMLFAVITPLALVGMTLGGCASSAHATTEAEYQAQIQALLEQLAKVQHQCFPQASSQLVFVDGEAESPVMSHETWGYFKVEFTMTAVGADQCFFRTTPVSGRNYEVLSGNLKNSIEVAAVWTAVGWSSLDTPSQFCVYENQTRRFELEVMLMNPKRADYFRVRLKGVDGPANLEFFPSPRSFVTDSVFINDVDYD